MLTNNYPEALKNHRDVRKTLISLKEELRTAPSAEKALACFAGDFSVLIKLLKDPDPKVRKNAALVLGEVGKVKELSQRDEIRESLWNAYIIEETHFIRADYIKALSAFDCTPYLTKLKERKKTFASEPAAAEEAKHLREESAALQKLLLQAEPLKKHVFTGWQLPTEIILLTNRLHRQTVAAQIPEGTIRMLAGGLRFVTENLKDVLAIRTWTEMLFPIPGTGALSGTPEEMAEALLAGNLLEFLQSRHSGGRTFPFRLEVRASQKGPGLPCGDAVKFVKRLAGGLEQKSGGLLWNSVNDYEVEIRLVQNREGQFLPLLRLSTLPDRRFAYRKNTLPTSIAPANAALLLELSQKYLTEGAQVLDPFCGTGTMLIERSFFGGVGDRYGIDTFGEAIEKARENTKRARMNIHYIHRDFFDFTHAYLFDEIVTDLPAAGQSRTPHDVEALYGRFLAEAGRVLKPDAILLLYTQSFDILERCAGMHREYRLLKKIRLNERDKSGACVLRYCGTSEGA